MASRAATVPVIIVAAAAAAAVMGTPVRMDVKTAGAAGGHGVRIIIRRRVMRSLM